MSRKKILWLCSWYPGQTEPYNGDFIQRHARAAAIFNDIHVIHVFPVQGKVLPTQEMNSVLPGLREKIIYSRSVLSVFGRISSHFNMLWLYKTAIQDYIKREGVPNVVHVHVPMKAGIAGVWLKKNHRVPLLVSEHWGIYNSVVRDRFDKRSSFFKRMTKKVFQHADRVSTVSQFMAEKLREYFRLNTIDIIPNAVNTEHFHYREETPAVFRFLHVSNMVDLKNVAGILRAFKDLLADQRAELVLVGNTDSRWSHFANQLEIPGSAIRFCGEVAYQEVAKEMQDANCLLLFSDMENSPCVIGEALCCGLPVIATEVGGIPELVTSKNGILVRPRQEAELKSAMINMINSYPSFDRETISVEARRKFSYEKIGQQFDSIYQQLLT